MSVAEPTASESQGYLTLLLKNNTTGVYTPTTYFWNTYAVADGTESVAYAHITISGSSWTFNVGGYSGTATPYYSLMQINSSGGYLMVTNSSTSKYTRTFDGETIVGWKYKGNIGYINQSYPGVAFEYYFSDDGTAKLLQQNLELLMQLGTSDTQLQSKVDETNRLQEEQNDLQEHENQLQQESNDLQKESNEQQKGFFDNFFGNLVDSVVGLFIPSSEEMSDLFDQLNQFFSDTFGFLYYPFDFLIRAFDVFLNSDSSTGITFPSFSIMGYEVWPDMKYDIANESVAGDIFGYVRIGTGVILSIAFVTYLRNYFDKRFGGGGN